MTRSIEDLAVTMG